MERVPAVASGRDAELALVEACRRGEREAQHAFYEKYRRRVFSLIARIVGAQDAEELVQEVFLRAYRGLEKFRGDAQLSTWMYRLAVNAALSYATRTQARQKRDLGEEALMALPAEDAPATDPRLRARLRAGAGGAAGRLSRGARAARRRGAAARGDRRHPRLPRRHVEVAAAQGARQDARPARGCAVRCCRWRSSSALVDGDLSPRQAARVRTHVEGCAVCQRALADFETMKRGLGALPERAGEDNWSVVVNRLAQPLPPPARNWGAALSWRFAVPSVAGGGRSCAGGGAWLRWHNGRGMTADAVIAHAESEFHVADEHYRHAVDELRAVAEHERRDWPLPKRAEYEAAQSQLQVAVARCRAVADERPADVDAEELLFAAYRKEIRFYEDQMMREAR